MATVGIALFPGYASEMYRSLAAECERLGYSRLWVPDERFYHDVAVCMAQVAMSTSTVEIGSAVTDPFIRHPALTAQMMASLDELSSGRIVVGLGAGLAGFKALGIKSERPVEAMREAIDLMRRLWTGETIDYRGKTVAFDHARLDVRPLRARIPIVVAGRGPHVLRLGGRVADGVMIGSLATPAGLAYAFGHIDSGLAASGRSRDEVEVALWLHAAISDDGAAARDALRPIVTSVLSSSRGVLKDLGLAIPPALELAIAQTSHDLQSPEMQAINAMLDPETMRHFSMAGTPDQCRAHLREIVAAGVRHVALVPWLVPGQSLQQFATMFAETVGTTI